MNLDELKLPFLFNDRFSIVEKLGSGGMGSIYKAHDQLLSKDIAVKLINEQLSEEHIVRFQHEAKAIAKLKHENIVEVYDFAQSKEEMFYLTMELIQGESMADLIKRKGRLSYTSFATLIEQVLAGLSHAHANGVIHRDIKPSNIMLAWDENEQVKVKLVDFGLAKFIKKEDQKLTQTGAPLGSPYYISPEQVEGKQPDERADIYSLGCLMYEGLTGHVPFKEDEILATMAKRLSEPPPPFSDKAPDLVCPKELEKLVMKCLERKPDERFSSIAQIKIEFDNILNSLAQIELPESGNTDNKKTYYKIFATVGVILLFVVVAGVSYKMFHEIETNEQRGSESLNQTSDKIKKKQEKDMNWVSAGVPIEDEIKRDNQIEQSSENIVKNTALVEEERNTAVKKLVHEFKLSDTSFRGADCPLPLRVYKMFSKAPRLDRLFLKGSNVDDEAVDYISRCKGLISLDLSANEGISLRAFSKLKRLKKLQHLDLSAMKLDDRYMVVVGQMPSLIDIDISNNGGIKLPGLEKLAELPRLEQITLGNLGLQNQEVSISIPDIVRCVNSNRSINHLGMKVDFSKLDNFEGLSKLKNIQRISLIQSKGVSLKVFQETLKIPNLQYLDLSETDINPDNLPLINQYPNIKKLSLKSLNLTERDLIYLLRLKHVEKLNIGKNWDLSKIAIENLRLMPALREVDSRYTSKPGCFRLEKGQFYRIQEKDI